MLLDSQILWCNRYKRKVAEEFGVPLFVQKIVDSGEEKVFVSVGQTSDMDHIGSAKGVSPLQLRTAAMALLRHGSSMPPERRDQLMEVSGLLLSIRSVFFWFVNWYVHVGLFGCCTIVLPLMGFSLM